MRWFIRNDRFYLGPVTDNQIDLLLSMPKLKSAGISCMAGNGKVETYVTLKTRTTEVKEMREIASCGTIP